MGSSTTTCLISVAQILSAATKMISSRAARCMKQPLNTSRFARKVEAVLFTDVGSAWDISGRQDAMVSG